MRPIVDSPRFARAVRSGLLAALVALPVLSRSAVAEETCERCDLTWVECARGVRQTSETCAGKIAAACRSGCDPKATDRQGVRDPTRFETCVRNCRRDDSCEYDAMRDRQRCDGLRALCRRDVACAS